MIVKAKANKDLTEQICNVTISDANENEIIAE